VLAPPPLKPAAGQSEGQQPRQSRRAEHGTETELEIVAVFLAQTHVLPPDSPLFKLVGNRDALLKVQLVGRAAAPAPAVTVTVTAKDGLNQTEMTLSGPATLSSTWEGRLGVVHHRAEDSWMVTIGHEWVQPGVSIDINAGDAHVRHELAVGAPTRVQMHMFDVHYFGRGNGDYPSGWEDELASKWPVAAFAAQRIRDIDFPTLVIPARPDVGTPNVRIKSPEEYFTKTGQQFDGEQGAALQWVHALSAAGGNQDTAMCYINIVGVAAGGQAGGFDGVGTINSVGVLHHELGR
jgi:hypothetical protein